MGSEKYEERTTKEESKLKVKTQKLTMGDGKNSGRETVGGDCFRRQMQAEHYQMGPVITENMTATTRLFPSFPRKRESRVAQASCLH